MLLRDHDEPACATRHCVSQPTSEMVVVCLAVLVLDDDLGAVFGLGNDVDAPASVGDHLGLADRDEVDADGLTNDVELLAEERREVGGLALPRGGQHAELEPPHTGRGVSHEGFRGFALGR